MLITYRNIILSFMMMVGVGLAGWTIFVAYRPTTNITPKSAALPDAFMEDIKTIILDKYGKPKMKLSTPKLIHFTENDTTQLQAPQLTLYRKSPNPWYITAQHAQATDGIDNIRFWENVIIHRAADENNPATVIKTSLLIVHPNQKTAETSHFITLNQPNLVVKATGMYANMNTGDIKLLSNARGEYVPEP